MRSSLDLGAGVVIGSYCCVKHRGLDWPSIICAEEMVPETVIKPSSKHKAVLLMHKLHFVWVLPTQITEFVPSARIHIALRDNADEVYQAYEAIESCGYADLSYWKDTMMAKRLDEEESALAEHESEHESEVEISENPKQSTCIPRERNQTAKPNNAKLSGKSKSSHRRSRVSKPGPRKKRNPRPRQGSRKTKQATTVAAPIISNDHEDQEGVTPLSEEVSNSPQVHDKAEPLVRIEGEATEKTGGFQTPCLTLANSSNGQHIARNGDAELGEATPQINSADFKPNTVSFSNPFACSANKSPLESISVSTGLNVTLLVGKEERAFDIPMDIISTIPFLKFKLVYDSHKRLLIRLNALDEEATNQFAAVSDFLISGDFHPAVEIKDNRLQGLATPEQYKLELLRYSTLFRIGQRLQLHDFLAAVVLKIGCLRPFPNKEAAQATALFLSTPGCGSAAEHEFRGMLVEWLASDINYLVQEYSTALRDVLEKHPGFVHDAMAITNTEPNDIMTYHQNDSLYDSVGEDYLNGCASIDEFLNSCT